MQVQNQLSGKPNALPCVQTPVSGSVLQFSSIQIDKDYCKKWNIYSTDFICLTKDGVLLRPTLYRIGAIGKPKLGVDKYFMLIKHTEAFYSKEILKMSKSKDGRHLESNWCILDSEGNEKYVQEKSLDYPYVVSGSCIYSVKNKYFNIETGYFYCQSYYSMKTSEFLFLNNAYDDDKSKRGVIKINLQDGSWELFS